MYSVVQEKVTFSIKRGRKVPKGGLCTCFGSLGFSQTPDSPVASPRFLTPGGYLKKGSKMAFFDKKGLKGGFSGEKAFSGPF
jgi:hypothetical protein